jgi:hypothetical protein
LRSRPRGHISDAPVFLPAPTSSSATSRTLTSTPRAPRQGRMCRSTSSDPALFCVVCAPRSSQAAVGPAAPVSGKPFAEGWADSSFSSCTTHAVACCEAQRESSGRDPFRRWSQHPEFHSQYGRTGTRHIHCITVICCLSLRRCWPGCAPAPGVAPALRSISLSIYSRH